MNLIEKAREFDRLDKPKEAVEVYEAVIQTAGAPLDVYVDLVALYFVCGDPGYSAAHNLSVEFLCKAETRMLELKEEVVNKFGYNSEIDFWIKYHDYILIGYEISIEEFEIVALSGDSPVPYLLSSLNTKNDEYRNKAEQAYLMSLGRETARKRYIFSILVQTFGKKRWSLVRRLIKRLSSALK